MANDKIRTRKERTPQRRRARRGRMEFEVFYSSRSLRLCGAFVALFILAPIGVPAAGLSQRFANTTLTLPQQPAQAGYQVVNAFGSLTFTQPTCIQTPPGETNRVFVLEKTGRIQVVTSIGAASPTKSQYMDLSANLSTSGEQGLLGLAFHPG